MSKMTRGHPDPGVSAASLANERRLPQERRRGRCGSGSSSTSVSSLRPHFQGESQGQPPPHGVLRLATGAESADLTLYFRRLVMTSSLLQYHRLINVKTTNGGSGVGQWAGLTGQMTSEGGLWRTDVHPGLKKGRSCSEKQHWVNWYSRLAESTSKKATRASS